MRQQKSFAYDILKKGVRFYERGSNKVIVKSLSSLSKSKPKYHQKIHTIHILRSDVLPLSNSYGKPGQ